FGAGTTLDNLVHGGAHAAERFPIDLEQHIPPLQTALGGWAVRIQTLDHQSAQITEVHHARHYGVEFNAGDAEVAANDTAVGDQLIHDPFGQPVRDGEADAVALLIAV